ncbi:hypothetical protein LJC36_03485, partial [Desulfovibrio sp. OttesenSCG-928-C14]|nr:hypothetical protein [Desulfovibrio sp. OttesenSCG-928-C14]
MPLLTTRDILRLLLVESLPSQGGVIISVTVPEAKEGEAAPPLPGRALSAPDADLGKAPGEALGKAPVEAREKAPAIHPADFFPSAA